MVVLRATDAAGNVNDCMVNVTVQDKLPPTIICPPNLTVDCFFAYDEENLNDFFPEIRRKALHLGFQNYKTILTDMMDKINS